MGEQETKGGASRRFVLQALTVTGLAAGAGAFGVAAAQTAADYKRWWERDYRIVQTNLREIDVLEDPRQIARDVKEFGGTAIVSNIGGIVAFYPTKLEYQYQNPYLKNDFVAEMIKASHAEGLAYLGRFDTSKALKPVYDAHPDWFVVNRDGTPTEFAGTYQACPSGPWLQDYALKMLREALTVYKPDGVFFNGVGFGQNDYAGRTLGSCVCNNCRTRFRAMYGLELPKVEGFADPNWRQYLEYQERIVGDIYKRMYALAGELIPGVPIFRGDDYEYVGRSELQRRVRRPAPEWPYQSGEQARGAKARNPGKPFSSTSTAHMDYPWRQVKETADYHILRFAQQLANGARLDLYCMGTLADQNDRSYLPPVSALFKWEAANSQHYLKTAPLARVGLYDSEAAQRFSAATPWGSYRAGSNKGAYAALIDSRLPFHFVNGEKVAEGVTRLADFDVIVAPHVLCMSDAEAAALDAFVSQGGLLIASGMTAGFDPAGRPRATVPLASFPIEAYEAPQKAEGWMLDPAKGPLRFTTNRVPIDAYYFGGRLRAGVTDLVPFAPDQRFGPPEFSYVIPGEKARTIPGVALKAHGKGHVVHIPWLNEWQYNRDTMPMHQQLIAALAARYAPAQKYALSGQGAVELAALRSGDRNALLHVINYAGQRNGRYDTPPELHGLKVGVAGAAPSQARLLVSGKTVTGVVKDGRTWFELPPLGAFEAVLLEG
ncbi:MAG: alpha-amylase family protein [Phenylobacterium sp.]